MWGVYSLVFLSRKLFLLSILIFGPILTPQGRPKGVSTVDWEPKLNSMDAWYIGYEFTDDLVKKAIIDVKFSF